MSDALNRSILIPRAILQAAQMSSGIPGDRVIYSVCVDWPELRLTDDQMLANAVALVYGKERPYPDHSIFHIALERYI